jgi:hypothetical protein
LEPHQRVEESAESSSKCAGDCHSLTTPLIAISLLEKHPNQMHWDENKSVWTFLDTFTGTRKNFSDDYFFYHQKSIDGLKKDYGLFWNGSSWNWPEGFEPKK